MLWRKSRSVSTDVRKIDELLERGVSEVIVKEDLRRALLSGRRLRVKLGIDPTSPHLHLGRAVSLLKLRDFEELGHQVVFILGDFTAVIGDTSDKEAERPMLSREAIETNKKTYFAQVGKLIDVREAELRRNSEWLEKLSYREIGEHADLFSLSDFVARENIGKRLSEGKRVSLREVLYPLMQGYDSVAVAADVELGGTDQKFNLLAGRTLQGHFKQKPQNIVMNPLIEGFDGRKMSSSWGNTINLTDAPSQMYGKIMSMHDDMVPDYFIHATRIPYEEAKRLARETKEGNLHPKDAKMRLARDIVTLYHGADAARAAENDFTTTFQGGGVPADLPRVSSLLGTKLSEAVIRSGLVSSNSEWKRLVAQGGVEVVGGGAITVPEALLEKELILKIGKRRFLAIELKAK